MWYGRLRVWFYSVFRLFTVHKMITSCGAFITIGGVIWGAAHSAGSNVPQIILTAWLCVLIVIAWGIVLTKTKQARLAEALPSMHDVFHQLRDAYYALATDGAYDTTMEKINKALASFANSFGIMTGSSCRACIKQVLCEGRPGDQDPRSVQVTTFCRFPDTPEPAKRFDKDYVSDNTDYFILFREPGQNYFYSNDLLNEKGYQNSHWTQEMVKEKRVPYKSTIVWPIRKKLVGEDHDTWGFLCVDSIQTHVFLLDLNFSVGAGFADTLYILLKEMDRRIAQEEAL